jgi:hypothetical protein
VDSFSKLTSLQDDATKSEKSILSSRLPSSKSRSSKSVQGNGSSGIGEGAPPKIPSAGRTKAYASNQPSSFYGKVRSNSAFEIKVENEKIISIEQELKDAGNYLENGIIPQVLLAIEKLLVLVKSGKEPSEPIKFLSMVPLL